MRDGMQEHTVSVPSAAKPAWASPPRQGERSPAGAAAFVICDHPIETAFEESKGGLGLDHSEVRTGLGWHHHMTRCMLAHHCLVRARLRVKKGPQH
jgi:hypothetical protein